MIRLMKGNLLTAEADALVNTVNCAGFMGKGIALQFKQAFPENFREYAKACKAGEVQPGRMLVHDTGSMVNPRYVINFPTKRHWRGKSRIEDIESGLAALVGVVLRLGIRSIAIPPLGCGLGGLRWDAVQPMIEGHFAGLPEVEALLFAPEGAPDPRDMPVNTARPEMTPARALFVKLMDQYQELSYRLTLLEVQKLAYFMQESGEPLRLRYEAGIYGPYADNLNKVLERMEGHFLRGYGDSQRPDVELELLPGAVAEADALLRTFPDAVKRLGRVSGLIEGFETPYGMELLSSTHWVVMHSGKPSSNVEDAIEAVHRWNERKATMFRIDHIRKAWDRLASQGWFALHPPV
ncbi:MAG: macro domain-containing protein [Candidatus Hydrogenedentes bacterium]|nr:macro domain-containing protein [Candidatus Hydrogenedentota bacterium]